MKEQRIVYLMRGLPGCGKSFTGRQLAGATGIVLETDEYFHTQVGDDPSRYDYRPKLLGHARQWNFSRFRNAVSQGISPVVVDRGNGLNAETQAYARFALSAGYQVELKEPDSRWWREVRVLLKYRNYLKPEVLDAWAEALAAKSGAHRVPAKVIRSWMNAWTSDLTVEKILDFRAPEAKPGAEQESRASRR